MNRKTTATPWKYYGGLALVVGMLTTSGRTIVLGGTQ